MDAINHHVRVSHLGPQVTANDLLQVFREFQPTNAKIVKRKSCRVAFVCFKRPERVAQVLEDGATLGFCLFGKRLLIQPLYSRCSMRALYPYIRLPYYTSTPVDLHPAIIKAMKKSRSVPLPPECVTMIANFLDYRDRARLECVSRVWRAGSINSHRRTTVLDLGDRSWGEATKVTDKMVVWLLKRCGDKLVTIELDDRDYTKFLTPAVMEEIVRYCPNIQNLYLEGIDLRPDAMLQIAMTIKSLRNLSVGPWDPLYVMDQDVVLAELLGNNRLLESLKFTNDDPVGKSFLDISPMLRHLEIVESCNINSAFLGQAIRQFRQLEYLSIDNCRNLTGEIFSALAQNENLHSTMKIMKFNHSYVHTDVLTKVVDFELPYVDLGIEMLLSFRAVTTLQLRYCDWITKDTIEDIGAHMTQLEYFDISGCSQICGEFALDPLSNLTNLKSLAMCDLHYDVRATFLKYLTHLRYLDCRYNFGVTDDDICEFLKNVPILVYVNLYACSNITRRVVEGVYMLRKNRRKIPLDIFLGVTKVKPHPNDTIISKVRIHYMPCPY